MPNNYGSLLQSIATQHIIETLGHQCEIINYVRKDERGLQGILSSMVSKKEWNENSLKKFAYIICVIQVNGWPNEHLTVCANYI